MAFPTELPASRVPDPMEAPPLRWGILGPGWIAEQFIRSTRAHTRQVIAAVGSRDPDKARAFARDWQIDTAHGSYEDLVADDCLDVIYVATPHNMHHQHVMMALNAGRNVLVEKPMALDHAQAADMVALAQKKGLFLCEALWTYFLPKFDVLQQIFDADVLGEIKSVHTEYGEYFTRDHRIFDPALAGGPLLDLGTYPLSLMSTLLGPAQKLVGLKQDDESGVHGQISIIMANAAGNQGSMSTTLYGLTPTNAAIVGTKGTLHFGSEFNLPGPFEAISADGTRRLRYDEPVGRHFEGLFYEAAAVARAISAVQFQTAQRPLAATLDMMQLMDKIRRVLSISWLNPR